MGELEDAYGNRYLLVLNREFEQPLEARIPLKGNWHIYEVSREDGQQYLKETADAVSVKLAPGDAVLLRLQPGDGEPFTAEYRLDG